MINLRRVGRFSKGAAELGVGVTEISILMGPLVIRAAAVTGWNLLAEAVYELSLAVKRDRGEKANDNS